MFDVKFCFLSKYLCVFSTMCPRRLGSGHSEAFCVRLLATGKILAKESVQLTAAARIIAQLGRRSCGRQPRLAAPVTPPRRAHASGPT